MFTLRAYMTLPKSTLVKIFLNVSFILPSKSVSYFLNILYYDIFTDFEVEFECCKPFEYHLQTSLYYG